jgi:hypothetical protein
VNSECQPGCRKQRKSSCAHPMCQPFWPSSSASTETRHDFGGCGGRRLRPLARRCLKGRAGSLRCPFEARRQVAFVLAKLVEDDAAKHPTRASEDDIRAFQVQGGSGAGQPGYEGAGRGHMRPAIKSSPSLSGLWPKPICRRCSSDVRTQRAPSRNKVAASQAGSCGQPAVLIGFLWSAP